MSQLDLGSNALYDSKSGNWLASLTRLAHNWLPNPNSLSSPKLETSKSPRRRNQLKVNSHWLRFVTHSPRFNYCISTEASRSDPASWKHHQLHQPREPSADPIRAQSAINNRCCRHLTLLLVSMCRMATNRYDDCLDCSSQASQELYHCMRHCTRLHPDLRSWRLYFDCELPPGKQKQRDA